MTGRLAPPLLNVDETLDGTTAILNIQGEVDVSNVHIPESAVRRRVADRLCERIILDMHELSYMDSAGVGWLVREIGHGRDGTRMLQLRGVTPSVQRMLVMTGIDEKFSYSE